MIIGQRTTPTGETLIKIIDYEGNVFEFQIGYRRITVPSRDSSGQPTTLIFNMTDLIEHRKVPVGTTADEAYAVLRIVRDMPRSSERTFAEGLIKNYLTAHRRQRTEDYLLRLGELYGARDGGRLFHAVHKGEFDFPAYLMREEETAKLVCFLLEKYPGACSSSTYVPNSWQKAFEYARIWGNSRLKCELERMSKQLHLDTRRIAAVFKIARYLERYKDDSNQSDDDKISQIGSIVK